MKTSQKGIDIIKHFEGFRDKVYKCAAGVPTIGYGHAIKAGEKFDVLTRDKAEALLKTDVREAEDAVNRLVTVPLTQNQFDALVSLVFNIGSGHFSTSTLLRYLNSGKYDLASQQFLYWRKAGGQILPGLEARRYAEKLLFDEVDRDNAA